MDRLYNQLHIWAGTPHEWSYCDCMTVLADWVQIVKGYDPAADLRGTYGDPAACPIGRAYRADPLPVCDKAFDGLPVVESASYGDIALARMRGQRFLFGAIKIKGREWFMKTEGKGIMATRFVEPVTVWGLNYAA